MTGMRNQGTAGASALGTTRRLSTETKSSFKTTELVVYVVAVAGVLVASYLVKTDDNHADYFRADQAWLYIVLLTIGYLLSRGLAKSGSRDFYTADHTDHTDHTDRTDH